jgi:diaminohydroxyphosphoribosylaminopyrimidine deaminase/5-amino-6-(5-phosphoribosylamino)uracil reductase
MFSAADHEHMAHALGLAQHGLFTTTPNPRVGCVIVREGAVVGEGWHERAGGAHAEVRALEHAGAAARGATVYVTLEPCSHTGRTPPCTDALIAAGVARVMAAMQDPDPRVSGRGLAQLRAAGIDVQCGLLENEARELNVGFVARLCRGRSWMRLKIAASLDGKTALSNGNSQWITGPEARRDGHRLRARACAVLTGIGTVLEDDPQLTVREVQTPRQPLRVIVDSRLEIPLTAKVLQGSGGVLVATASELSPKTRELTERGAEVVVMPNRSGKVDLSELMRELARRGLNEVHVEAGHKLNGSLLLEGLADELVIYLAPHLLGDAARGMFNLPEISDLAHRRELQVTDLRMIGADVRVTARVK